MAMLPRPVDISTAPSPAPYLSNVIKDGYFRGIDDLRSTGAKEPLPAVDTSFYPLCNEIEQDNTLRTLPKIATTQDTVHVGFSINFNYDLIAHRNPRFAIIADISPRAIRYYADISKYLINFSTRQEFAQTFQKYLSEQAESYFSVVANSDITWLCDLPKELTRPGSWLSSDEGFQTVKRMHEENRILYLELNILNIQGILSIRQWIESNRLTLDTVYVSNIPEWLKPGNEQTVAGQHYLDAMKALAQERTYVIDAFKRVPHGKDAPAQRVLQGRAELPAYEKSHSSKKANPHGTPLSLSFQD